MHVVLRFPFEAHFARQHTKTHWNLRGHEYNSPARPLQGGCQRAGNERHRKSLKMRVNKNVGSARPSVPECQP